MGEKYNSLFILWLQEWLREASLQGNERKLQTYGKVLKLAFLSSNLKIISTLYFQGFKKFKKVSSSSCLSGRNPKDFRHWKINLLKTWRKA
jgi:hypothetical protein